jgi:hypothetical protein
LAAWLAIYKDLVALLPRIVEIHAAKEERAANSGGGVGSMRGAPMASHRVSSAVSNVQNALQRAVTDWSARLSTQERELVKRTEAATEKLPVVSNVDDAMGELLYVFDPAELDAFWRWMSGAEQTWVENNKELVALRAQEALADTLADLPSEMGFQVLPASIAVATASTPRLRGHRIQDPGFFQSLGSTYRFVMSAVTAASGLGFFATRVIGGSIARLLPVVLGVVFAGTVVVAVFTLPKQRRQSMARLKARARETVERELLDAVRVRLKSVSDAQLSAIRKHLGTETARLKASWRDVAPSGSDLGASAPLSAPTHLMPTDVVKLKGEWKDAIEARIKQIEAELGANASPTTS